MESTWQPILTGPEAARAAAAVDAIAEAIHKGPLPDRNTGPSLSSGEAGFALLFEYLDRAHPGAGHDEIARQHLEQAIDALGTSIQMPGLYAGFTGVAWTVEHLAGGIAEDGEEDPNQDVDAALLDHLRQTPWTHHFDVISGLVGFGVYALERLPRPSAVTCLERVVERLAELAQPRPEGLSWLTPDHLIPESSRAWYSGSYDNLGVAHGTPGVIALLARAVASGVAADRASSLLAGGVSWLLAQKLPENETSVFPYGVGPDFPSRPARTAWCYGDPGIAAVLLLAGRAAGVPDWEREAIALGRAIARRPPESCGVHDAGLCHGAAGLGHVLNRLFQATGDPELLEGARAWFDRALAYQETGRGIGGFSALSSLEGDFERLAWTEDAAFLTGSTGIALALLAAISAVEPAWDRVMLLSPLP